MSAGFVQKSPDGAARKENRIQNQKENPSDKSQTLRLSWYALCTLLCWNDRTRVIMQTQNVGIKLLNCIHLIQCSVKKSEQDGTIRFFPVTGTVWPRHIPTAKLLGGCASAGSKWTSAKGNTTIQNKTRLANMHDTKCNEVRLCALGSHKVRQVQVWLRW